MPRPWRNIFSDFPEILRSSLTMTWKLPAIPLWVIAYISDTFFHDNLSRKNCNFYLFFIEGALVNPAILLVLNAAWIFLSLPTGTATLTFKTTCIHSLTLVNTLCNLYHGKIPLVRLSQTQRTRQKLWKCTISIAVFPAACDAKRIILEWSNQFVETFLRNGTFHGHHVRLLIRA